MTPDYSKLAEEQSATLQATARMLHIRNKGDDRYLASQLRQVANTLSILAIEAQEWKKDAEAKQVQIDRLMLEYCPEEMPEEQIKEWARHQTPVALAAEEKKT